MYGCGVWARLSKPLRPVNILWLCPCKAANSRPLHFVANPPHCIKVSGRTHGKTCLNYIHAKSCKLLCNNYLLLHIHGGARRLLTVPECCIKYTDKFSHLKSVLRLSCSFMGAWLKGSLFQPSVDQCRDGA